MDDLDFATAARRPYHASTCHGTLPTSLKGPKGKPGDGTPAPPLLNMIGTEIF